MKSFNKIFISVIAVVLVIFALANVIILTQENDEGRPYLVEVSRLQIKIENGTYSSEDLKDLKYVTNVTSEGENFYTPSSDYVVREIDGKLYRFDYTTEGSDVLIYPIIVTNVAFALTLILFVAMMLYARAKIILPFEKLKNVPYELSRGNLTSPIEETKSKYFGGFVWGVNVLRENLEQQKDRELQLQKDKKTLLIALSHDLKTPLSEIKLYSQALSKELYADKGKQIEIANRINEKTDEIESYVSQIITASREDFLSFDVSASEFYLKELVDKIVASYSEKLALVKTDFSFGEYGNCLLKGDLDRSVEVIQNLMENAIKYGDGRHIAMSFGTEEDCVLVSVVNSGCTLPENEINHIFESFFRGSNSDKRKGSGLGLYIARQLMLKMDGEVFAKLMGEEITVTAVFRKA